MERGRKEGRKERECVKDEWKEGKWMEHGLLCRWRLNRWIGGCRMEAV